MYLNMAFTDPGMRPLVKALLHDEMFLATCNEILLLKMLISKESLICGE